MTGKYDIIVKNARLQYKFTVERNITILRGDSATGKTTLIDMIAAYQTNGENSGVTISCEKNCAVLTSLNWELNLRQIRNSIVFIDEGEAFVRSVEFAHAIQETDNYYVIATRAALFNLPYSTKEIYGIKNKSGNRYQGTKRLYSEFIPLCDTEINTIPRPDYVIVEDSNAGYEFFSSVCEEHGVTCISAQGKSNIYRKLVNINTGTILVIADGAAFGPEIEKIIALKKVKNLVVYLPESFEWLILKSGLVENVEGILGNPAAYIESERFFSWERFFTDLLVSSTQDNYLRYNKNRLNPNYLHNYEKESILSIMPQIEW